MDRHAGINRGRPAPPWLYGLVTIHIERFQEMAAPFSDQEPE
jgi:hypothetical protein